MSGEWFVVRGSWFLVPGSARPINQQPATSNQEPATSNHVSTWRRVMADISLEEQLRCAHRELELRTRIYPRLVAQEVMLSSVAARERAAMEAIVRTLQQLVARERSGAVVRD